MGTKKRSQKPRGRGRDRRLSIRSELRKEPDVRKIARAVVALALARAEAEAEAERQAMETKQDKPDGQ
jgi:hypothetical protein